MEKIPVIVNGAHGKMGQITAQTIQAQKNYALVASTGRQDDLVKIIQDTQAKIVIDFSTASSCFSVAKIIIEQNVHPVIGTSGLLPNQVAELQSMCARKQLGGIIAPNFSIGAILMMRYAALASRYFARAEIIEMHHDQKADAPSGTAVKTAAMLSPQTTDPLNKNEVIAHVRGGQHNHIPIHSIRLPGLLAHQEVLLGNPGEILTLRHDMLDRKACMAGVLLACEKVVKLNTLIYGLEQLLE